MRTFLVLACLLGLTIAIGGCSHTHSERHVKEDTQQTSDPNIHVE